MNYNLVCAESLVTFMLTNVRLSVTDFTFLDSILAYSVDKNMVTSNQDKLFRKVIEKYKKQFSKHNINVEEALKLEWTVKVVPSANIYTEAHISIEDGLLCAKTPFNKKFISDVRKIDDAYMNIKWNRDKHRYETQYNPKALMYLLTFAKENFPKVNMCPAVTEIISELDKFKGMKYWTPTLTLINNTLYIAAANEYVMDAIADVPLKCDPRTLAELVHYGISIADSVIELASKTYDKDEVLFASTHNTVVEHKNIPRTINWLSNLGCDLIFQGRGIFPSEYLSNAVDNDISVAKKTSFGALLEAKKPVIFKTNSILSLDFTYQQCKPFKVIGIVNSEPINIR